MYIKKVEIKNFRSIVDEEFKCNDINVLVGNNDIGKSNFLKALNLFFNNETDHGSPFNFNTDYSNQARIRKKKAKEIVIEITFTLPKSYHEPRDVVWTKKWRDKGFHLEEKKYSDLSEIPTRKKVNYWLSQVRYRYVPAIKGNDYFISLLGDLHNVLAETIETELKIASSNFIESIRGHTREISSDLLTRLGFASKLQIPTDLSLLFEILDFETEKGGNDIPLKFRGDGIKVRHIPIILKFISEQENRNRHSGSPNTSSIWGYEEPENNLELSTAFKQAKEFIDYSKDIQMFITTHSPAFYSLEKFKKENISTFIVNPHDDNENRSHIIKIDPENIEQLDSTMGLLPFISPYIEQEIEKNKKLVSEIERYKETIKDSKSQTLFVEGPTDKTILVKAFSVLKSDLNERIIIQNGGGNYWVKDMFLAWHFNKKNKTVKAAALFDEDTTSKKAKKEINKITNNPRLIKSFTHEPPKHLIEILSKGIKIPFAIEELFPPTVWEEAEKNGWLEDKQDILTYNTFRDHKISFEKHCKNKGLTEKSLLYLNKVKMQKKKDFAQYVTDLPDEKNLEAFDGFRSLIKQLDEYF